MSFAVKQIPYPLLWDKMPVDISTAFKDEKPAGKHGFMKASKDRFIFEDGTEVRFWGTNFNAGANFPEHSHSEKVARRLAMTGINLVRFHQMDAEWATPNIFQFVKGKLLENTGSFDPESMDRLDYLVYCLKNQGIYIYMDFITYRRFKSGDGIENAHLLREAAKPYNNFSRALIELQKEYISNILLHENPYTGLKYKDDPCIVMAEIANESDLFHKYNSDYNTEPYRREIVKKYEEFARLRNEEIKSYDFTNRDRLITEFLLSLQSEFYDEMTAHIRGLGAKFMLTGTNWYTDKEVTYSNRNMDFTDAHTYLWLGNQGKFKNMPHIKADKTIAKHLILSRLKDKPFFVSEWDAPWPNEWRADTTVMFAAIGALQGWSGFTIHTYRYGTCEDESVTKKIGRYIALGGVYHRGVFDTYNDPAKFGLFYHAALITRRGDVKPAEKTVTIGLSRQEVADPEFSHVSKLDDRWVEQHKVCFDYDVPSTNVPPARGDSVISDTGEIYRNKKSGTGVIDTGRTKAVYGFIGNQKHCLSGFTVEAENDFATIALSSLTDDDIEKSQNMLLTAVGRADNKDSVYNEDHTELIKEGTAPIMIDVIEAEISIKTEKEKLRVWSVNFEGYFTGIIPSTYEDGILKFNIGKEYESMYYLIQEQ